MPLPIRGEVDARFAQHGERGNAVNLSTIWIAPMVLLQNGSPVR
jgi:hypothetical protein